MHQMESDPLANLSQCRSCLKLVLVTAPIYSLPGHHAFLRLRYSSVAKYALQHSDTSADDDVISDVLHDSSCLSGYQGQEHWSAVQVPEKEQFAYEKKVQELIIHTNRGESSILFLQIGLLLSPKR